MTDLPPDKYWLIQILYMTTAQLQYPELKEQYERLCELGEGAFGKVYLVEQTSLGANSTHTNNN